MSRKQDFSFTLGSRYTLEEGTIILTGLQALVRLPIDQHKADKRNGLHTGTFISGYRGSPLGGYDTLLQREAKLLKENHVVFVPGVNEDLAATAVMGSQTVNLLPSPKYDGVNGIWYGKGPGVDRSGDVFKHAQTTGVQHNGGVLAIAGDDPTAKSSTIPSHSEIALYDAQMPILYPGNVQEVIDMGRFGFEMSRYSGSWVGYKIVTDVADSYQMAHISPMTVTRPEFEYEGRPWRHTLNPALLAPHTLHQEKEIIYGRLEAAKVFAKVNKLNRIAVSGENDTLGIVATGKTYYDIRETLYHLGFDEETMHKYGIRLLKLGMMYPLEPSIIDEFAEGLQEIWVIEEKRSFIEWQLRDLLYNKTERPNIYGKQDAHGRQFIRADFELDVDQLIKVLGKKLAERIPDYEPLQAKVRSVLAPPMAIGLNMSGVPARTPYFCSGCPHNRSTTAPEGSLQGGGIGCSTLSILMDRKVTGVTQMGGEGAQWVGSAPFTETDHIFQHIGDGTLFHSGSMAIRQSLASDANMTYKILYNGAVAMTGGQHADGEIPIPELTHFLKAEGIVKTIICTYDLEKYPAGLDLADGTEVWDRDRLDEAQLLLRDVKGITAIIYDQPCATELRRQRKRGKVKDPNKRIFINEAVCEGCGDCGVKSNCLSVFPVDTEFGRKTQIHQSSCNKDYTCLEGNCPAFVAVEVPEGFKSRKPVPTVLNDQKERLANLPEPRKAVPDEGNIFMTGIGGTGVVTLGQILSTAALMDGKYVNSLDQTGLSQKGGPVVGHIKVRNDFQEMSSKVGSGSADAYIVFDLLTGTTEKSLKTADSQRTTAVVSSSKIPTGAMVKTKEIKFPEGEMLKHRLEMTTRKDDNVYLDAIEIAENLFGSHMPANIMTVGAAYQAGIIPISAEAIEAAIRLNGVAIEMNMQAFRVGRLITADPEWLPSLNLGRIGAQPITTELLTQEAETLLNRSGATGELRRLLSLRISELVAYQNVAYAEQYVTFVEKVMQAEGGESDGRLSQAVARYLFKLMAYKDEYEVARLSLKPAFHQAITDQFGPEASTQYMLHPPILKAIGMKKKIGFGSWFNVGFRLLSAMKGLRGTALDIFGYDEVRREERQLIGEYRTLVEKTISTLDINDAKAYDRAVKLAELPDLIRGYDEVKLGNIATFRQQVTEWQAMGTAVAAD